MAARPSITAPAGLCPSHVEVVLETRLSVPLNRSQGVIGTWDPSPERCLERFEVWDPIPAVTPGLHPRTGFRSWDWSRDRSWDRSRDRPPRVPGRVQDWSRDRSCVQGLSLIPITSSCIPRRSPLQEAGTGGRGSADLTRSARCPFSPLVWGRVPLK